jgi:hypothetical protein
MERIILNWDEVVNSYEGPDIFEFWFCNEMHEKVEDYGNPEDLDAVYEKLTERYGNSKFRVTHHDFIKWHGKLNSDFRLSEVTE